MRSVAPCFSTVSVLPSLFPIEGLRIFGDFCTCPPITNKKCHRHCDPFAIVLASKERKAHCHLQCWSPWSSEATAAKSLAPARVICRPWVSRTILQPHLSSVWDAQSHLRMRMLSFHMQFQKNSQSSSTKQQWKTAEFLPAAFYYQEISRDYNSVGPVALKISYCNCYVISLSQGAGHRHNSYSSAGPPK